MVALVRELPLHARDDAVLDEHQDVLQRVEVLRAVEQPGVRDVAVLLGASSAPPLASPRTRSLGFTPSSGMSSASCSSMGSPSSAAPSAPAATGWPCSSVAAGCAPAGWSALVLARGRRARGRCRTTIMLPRGFVRARGRRAAVVLRGLGVRRGSAVVLRGHFGVRRGFTRRGGRARCGVGRGSAVVFGLFGLLVLGVRRGLRGRGARERDNTTP